MYILLETFSVLVPRAPKSKANDETEKRVTNGGDKMSLTPEGSLGVRG